MKVVLIIAATLTTPVLSAQRIDQDSTKYETGSSRKIGKENMNPKSKSDSILTKQLDEVVVEADKMYMTVNKVSYTPTKQQRNSSANGTMLLQQLAISQLTVNAIAGSVTTNTGEAVAFFIDGVPATNSDVADINTRDVLKVEVLDYPTDPKFRNSPHVVNYIMQKYEFGGYTKLNTTEMLLSCFSTYNTLNSKMVYKNMTFDARGYYQDTNGSHYGSDEVHMFHLPGYEKEAPDGIRKSSILESSKYISNRPSASFRALYQGNKTQFSSSVYWSLEGTRSDSRRGELLYTPNIFDSDKWQSEYPSHKNTVSWSNDFFQQLPKDWALSASLKVSYDHLNQQQMKSEEDIVIRDLTAKEDIWSTSGDVDVSKIFNGKHTVSVHATCVTYKSNINYTGSTEDMNHHTQLLLAPGVSYTFNPNEKLYTRLGFYATYYNAKSSDVVEKKFYPTVNFNLTWMPNRLHRIGATFNYAINTPSGSQTNSLLLQTDMLRWSQGNPNLQSYRITYSQLDYNWMPSQYFNIAPVASWIFLHNYFTDTYTLTNDGKGILVRPENCGNYHDIRGMINFSAYALNRKLIIQVNPLLSHDIFSGEFNIKHTSFRGSVSATYYWKQFYVSGSYMTPKKYFYQGDPIKRKTRSEYWLMAGWGNSSWTVSAFVINPFRNHWNSDEMEINTPNYSMQMTSITVNSHRRINLSVAYTIGYGKKVARGNDLQDVSGSSTSIR